MRKRLYEKDENTNCILEANKNVNMATGSSSHSLPQGAIKGVKTGDSQRLREIDRAVAWAFQQAKELSPGTITRRWVATVLKRSESWVRDNWRRNPYFLDDEEKEQRALSQEAKEVIRGILSRPKKKSVVKIIDDLEKMRGKKRSYGTVYRFLKEEKARAFHIITAPKINAKSAINRLDFCDLLSDWDENDFLHLAPSDEFFVYAERKANHQNDRIWAYSLDDINNEDRIREKSKYPTCIGIFIVFTAKRMTWVIKEKGQSWSSKYFQDEVLADVVIPFLRDRRNVIDKNEVTFLHDKAPCMKAIRTQQLLRQNEIDFFDNTQWPGSSPDLNVAENLGAIMKDRVEDALQVFSEVERSKPEILMNSLNDVLQEMSDDTELFEKLLRSYPDRLRAVREAKGWHTRY